jgi:hypothetical protein
VSVRHRTDSHVLASSVSDNTQRLKKVYVNNCIRKKQAYLAIIALIGGLISYTDSFSVWDKRVCLFIIEITPARSEFQDNAVENPDFLTPGANPYHNVHLAAV